MNRKINLALLALLGFSTGCSSVKHTPRDGKSGRETLSETDPPAIQARDAARQPVGPEFSREAYPIEGADSLGGTPPRAVGGSVDSADEPSSDEKR